MAVSATNNTLLYFALGLCETLGIANVDCLGCTDMVEVKRGGMPRKSAISATALQFVVVKPTANGSCSIVRFLIYLLAITGNRQSFLSPVFRFLRVVNAFAWFSISRLDLIWITLTPTLRRFTSLLFESFAVLHNWIIQHAKG